MKLMLQPKNTGLDTRKKVFLKYQKFGISRLSVKKYFCTCN